MITYTYRALLDRAHLSNNWILEFCASLLHGKPECGLGQGKKTLNPNTAVIHDSNVNGFYPRANNSGKCENWARKLFHRLKYSIKAVLSYFHCNFFNCQYFTFQKLLSYISLFIFRVCGPTFLTQLATSL